MILRVWILGILLIVLLWFIWPRKEGFQAGSVPAPVPLSATNTRTLFWSIIAQQKAGGSQTPTVPQGYQGTPGQLMTNAGSNTIKDLISQVMNPSSTDKFKIVFGNYISIFALAKYSLDPVQARNALLDRYDSMYNELATTVQSDKEKADAAAFNAGPSIAKATSCKELNDLAMSLYGKLIQIQAIVTDLSGTEITAEALHDENRRLQLGQAGTICTNQGATPSPACIALASQDETLFPVIHNYDKANISLLTNGQTVQSMLNLTLQAYNGMACAKTLSGSYSGLTVDSVFSPDYLLNIGVVDTQSAVSKLEELSPYYISANTINYFTRQTVASDEYSSNIQTTTDYLKYMSKMTNDIVSLTSAGGNGQYFNEDIGGIDRCPAGFYCAQANLPVVCPAGYYCPEGTTGDLTSTDGTGPVPCPANTYSGLGATSSSDCKSTIPNGYYINDAAALVKCPKGTFCDYSTTVAKPTPCPAGMFNGEPGQLICKYCPAGSYCEQTDMTLPCTKTPCPKIKTCTSPKQCPIGTYSSVKGTITTQGATTVTTCQPCHQGTSCPNKGMAMEVPCLAGTYSSMGPAPGVVYTPTGGSSATLGSTKCEKGPAGKYSPNTGAINANSFLACPAGSYCPAGASSANACPPGYYCDVASLSEAKPCPAGTYGDSVGQTNPQCKGACNAGYYCAQSSVSATQAQCPVGYYCPGGNVNFPSIECPAGSFCPAGSSAPSPCLPGTYNRNTRGQDITACISCDLGYYCPAAGTVNPIKCPAGTYCPTGSQSTNTCQAGYYCPNGTDLKACPPGTYNPTTGSSSMTSCILPGGGYYSSNAASTTKISCPAGYYCPNTTACSIYSGGSASQTVPLGTQNPIPCPKGTFCGVNNLAQPYTCPAGTTSTYTGATFCSSCAPGTVSSIVAARNGSTQAQPYIAATICLSSGTYLTEQGEYLLCPPGTMCNNLVMTQCPAGSVAGAGQTSCTACGPGYYADSARATCLVCPAGTACNNGTIVQCPPGSGGAGPGATTCTPCPAGMYSSTDTNGACTPCPGGTYSLAGATSCIVTPPNTYTTNSLYGSTAGSKLLPYPANGYYCYGGYCDTCEAGYYSNANNVPCKICALGTYSIAGAAACTSCPINTYSDVLGSANGCIPCDAGTSTKGATGSNSKTRCQACDKGYYSDYGTNCMKCPVSTYADVTGSAGCAPCDAGTTHALTGATSSSQCTPCPNGTFSNFGDPICTPCDPGTYTDGTTGKVGGCAQCPAGTFSNTSGTASCTPCSPGTATYGVSSQCTACMPGTFSSGFGAAECTECPAGQGANATRTGCQPCPAGTYYDSYFARCTICPAGTYNVTLGAFSCTAVPTNYYSSTDGTTYYPLSSCPAGYACGTKSAVRCPAGTYSTGGAATCTPNPTNTYSGSGATSPTPISSCPAGYACGTSILTPCAPGTYSPAGATTCSNCPAGSYSNTPAATSSSTCQPCGPGTYSSGGSTKCIACPAGSYTYNVSSSTSCLSSCPAGYSCSGAIATACAPGTYSAIGAGTCSSTCPAGYSCSTTGAATICPAGTFALAGAMTCSPCATGQYSMPGSSACATICPAGYICSGNTMTMCPAGTYSLAGATSCTPNPVRSYSGSGAGTYTQCPAGYGCDNTGKVEICPAGTYSPTNQNACSQCPAGTYYGGTGGTSISACRQCTAGTYSAAGASTCLSCTYYGTSPNNTPNGVAKRFSPNGSSTCSATCPAGYGCVSTTYSFQGNPGALPSTNSTVICSPGTYSVSTNVANLYGTSISDTPTPGYTTTTYTSPCLTCPPGQVVATSGASSCSECPIGSAPSADKTTCVLCSAGTYAATGFPVCLPCPINTYSLAGASSCTNNPPHHYSGSGAGTYTQCPAGYGCDTGMSILCAPGTYSSATENACSKCPGGRYSNATGATSSSTCQACEAGTYSAAGASTCSSCTYYGTTPTATPLGMAKWFSPRGSPTCSKVCPAGYGCLSKEYQAIYNTININTTTICSKGSYSSSVNLDPMSTYTVESGKGYYLARSPCLPCPDGKVSTTAGAASCSQCAAGTVPSTDKSICNTCTAGTYAASGDMSCSSCPPGKVSVAGAASCSQCPAGRVPSADNTTCVSCPTGTTSTDGITCKCPTAGHVYSTTTQTCTPCPAGTYVNNGVCSSCTYYGTTPSVTPLGLAPMYSRAASTTCSSVCPAGYSCLSKQYYDVYNTIYLNTTTICPAGTYSSDNNMANMGEYTADSGKEYGLYRSDCNPCPAGKTSVAGATSQDSCSACPAGKVISADQTKCESCPAGMSSTDGITCGCPAGTYLNNGTCSSCDINPDGTGQFNAFSLPGSSTCTSVCPAGYSCSAKAHYDIPEPNNLKNTTTICPAGTYSNSIDFSSSSIQFGVTPNTTYIDDSESLEGQTYYKLGSVCIPCPDGETSAAGASSCTSLQGFQNYSGSTTKGTKVPRSNCPAGYSCSGNSITQCPAGTYSTADDAVCTPCIEGTYSLRTRATSVDTCRPCATGYSSPPGSTRCSVKY